MRVLRAAVVGAGRIGWQFHIPQVVQHEGFELVAVVDPLRQRLDEVRSAFGVEGYLDYAELLNGEALDLVVIASPTPFHADQAVAAFRRGCDVFCDKPMATSLVEADRMVASAEKHGRKLMIYQPRRANQEMVSLREILRQGLIGPLYMVKRARASYQRRNDWQALRIYGGGTLNNYGAHHIDELLYLSGSRAKRITCSLRSVVSLGDADDVVKVVIETESRVILDLDINMASAYPMPGWYVLGKYGSIFFDESDEAWRVRFLRPGELQRIGLHEELAAPGRRYGSGETLPWQERIFPLAEFRPVDYYEKCYEYYALDGEPFVPVAESREVMRVLDICQKDAART